MKPVDQQLFRALKQEHPTAVKHALLDGANPNAFSPREGMTALAFACKLNVSELVRALAMGGADSNQQVEGMPLLSWASFHGFDQSVHCLLDGFANLHATDVNKQTALHAAVNGRHGAIIKMLARKGLDVLAKDENGQTPRSIAEGMKRMDLVHFMPLPEVSFSPA